MSEVVDRVLGRYRDQTPLVRGVVAALVVGFGVGLVAVVLDAFVFTSGRLPSLEIGGVAGLLALFLVWQQGQPGYDPEAWSSLGVAPAPTGATVVRTYKGSPASAAAEFQRDAAYLAGLGYSPVSQIYAPGSWGCGAFLVALLLCLILIGILIFIYMIIVKPAGTLTVTYSLTAQPVPGGS